MSSIDKQGSHVSTADPQIYLASASPRRKQLLEQLGVRSYALSIEVDESPVEGETARAYVERLALAKARAGWARSVGSPPLPVLGADTAVILDGEILGKPRDEAHFLAMFNALSGRRHEVLTAVALVEEERGEVMVSASEVVFRPISLQERIAYWRSGEPQDKAGGYAIQGLGAVFVSDLRGSFSGVMGLPLYETAQLLRDFGIEVLSRGSADQAKHER